MSPRPLEIVEAGQVPYAEALAWQRRLATARIERQLDHDVLLLLQHPPVITVGRAARGAHTHVLNPTGIDVVEVERGGDVTFHGPGQLVGYPILDLTAHRQDVHWYLRALETTLIDALSVLGVPAARREGFTGVWTAGRKIASLGVHVKQWVTWHGFALNVTTDLSSFDRIVPCGIDGVAMTSIARERGSADWRVAAAAVSASFRATFGFDAPLVTTGHEVSPAVWPA